MDMTHEKSDQVCMYRIDRIDMWEELMSSAVAGAGIIIVGASLGHERKPV